MEYTIVRAKGANDLKTRVNERIKVGWRPQGGVSSYIMYNDVWFCQAMIMGKDNEN